MEELADQPRIFYAFPSSPADLSETLKNASNEINKTGVVKMQPWTNASVTGGLLLSRITHEIDQAQVFACDLTYLNDNVLFELGYAIGKSKPIWISVNSSIAADQDSLRTQAILRPIGYAAYTNQNTLISKLFDDQPWDSGFPSLGTPRENSSFRKRNSSIAIYLRAGVETDASIALSQLLEQDRTFRDTIVDDPTEVPVESLDWYVDAVRRVDAVLSHLLGDHHHGSVIHNSKCALVSGIAHGMGKPVLMLAHTPYVSPLDFQTMLRVHLKSAQCSGFAAAWLTSIASSLAAAREVREARQARAQRATELQSLSVGETIAEHESGDVFEYFLETDAYHRALEGRQSIFVGRKGTGKSANLYAIAAALKEDRENHVCIIKPVAYEVSGVLQVLQRSLDRAERGFLVESMWKFLIYTELARSLAERLAARPSYHQQTAAEADLLAFITQHEPLIMSPFSLRLQTAVDSLAGLAAAGDSIEQRARVSERLHERVLTALRQHLSRALDGMRRVVVLVDNLDKAWGSQADVAELSDLIFGLLGVAGRISNEFAVATSTRDAVDLGLVVFLRSDIFQVVQEVAREPDKIEAERLSWNDPEQLIRLVEQRLLYSTSDDDPDQIWDRFFVSHVDDRPVKEFITSTALPRPRDVLYLVKRAIGIASNRGHLRVESDDLKAAAVAYSEYALLALAVEDDPRLGRLEEVLIEFAGLSRIVTGAEVDDAAKRAGVPAGQVARYRELLCDVNFLGIQAENGSFEFAADESRRRVLSRVASAIASRTGVDQLFAVNEPFWPVLQIS